MYFNLDEKFTRLSGLVGFDDISDTVSNLPVSIFGDGKLLYSGTFSVGDLPAKFDLNISGVKQLKFFVQYSSVNAVNAKANTVAELVDFINLYLS